MYDLVIKNAKIVTGDEVINGNVAVKDGKISCIVLPEETPEAAEILDLEGKILLPGGIDCHVHFNEPGYTWREDFFHGSQAAAAGGITTVIDMPMQNTPAVIDADILRRKAEMLWGKSAVDYGFWGGLVKTNAAALEGLDKQGALAFKCFMCNPGKDYTSLDLAEIEQVLLQLKPFNGLAGFHCEDYGMIEALQAEKIAAGKISRQDYLEARPVEAEMKAAKDIIHLLEKTGGKAHICHVSHPDVAVLIGQAKAKGLDITAETCMHYLLFTGEDVVEQGTYFKCSPPLRSREDSEKLWEYVADGTIDCICSDHSPSEREEKAEDAITGTFGAWGGISGVQTALQAFWNYAVQQKGLQPTLIAKAMSVNPAKIFGIYGTKGDIKPGFDADFTVIDAGKYWCIKGDDLRYKNKFSAFTGQTGVGMPIMTILRGKVIFAKDHIQETQRGRHIVKNGRGS